MDIQKVTRIAINAGASILEIYNDETLSSSIAYKKDQSPLTLADTASHKVIMAGLKELAPDVPIISEEGKDISFDLRQDWNPFWLVDPLDGTKEFIKRNGEFTVNIALIENLKPILGVIFAPTTNLLYYGSPEDGAYKVTEHEASRIKVNCKEGSRIAVRSRSHANPREEEILDRFGVVDSVSIGSSLKFCLVADGTADIYYRHGPTMEWDIAAGQAIVTAAGGKVFRDTTTTEFTFNKPDLRNGSFLCTGF